jgi:hypothetical protein
LGARAVHLRLLLAEDDPEVALKAREAAGSHPEDSYLQVLLHQATGEIQPLSRAIELETRPARRSEWLRQLCEMAASEEERSLAQARLRDERDRRLAAEPEGLPELMGWMERAGFFDLAQETLAAAERAQPSAEAIIELTLLGARLDARESKPRAAERIGILLQQLAADHPRRGELVLARREYGGTLDGSEPDSPAGAVDAAAVLEADGKRSEAGQALVAAALRHPHLGWIEDRARGLLADEPRRPAYSRTADRHRRDDHTIDSNRELAGSMRRDALTFLHRVFRRLDPRNADRRNIVCPERHR